MTPHIQQLMEKLQTRQAKVGIVGLGYVGLPLAVAFAEAGFEVLGIDLDARKVEQLNRGESYIPDIPTAQVAPLVAGGKLQAFATYDILRKADAVSICVPTPLRKTKDPDMQYIIQATEAIAKVCHAGMLVVLESTTYPGTTQEILAPRLQESGLKLGEEIFVAFSPERIDPGNQVYHVRNTPKVVGGMTPACLEMAKTFYGSIVEQVVTVSSPTSAEMVKLLENTFRAVNIGLVNEIALMCDKLDINVWEVIEAAASKPFGFMPFYPGPGLGGHCIPVDPHYLSWKLKTLNYTARFIELASEINTSMPYYVVNKITQALNEEARAVRGSRIAVLGVAYKKDIDDVRESPALDVIQLLEEKGALVEYHDPYVPSIRLEGGRYMASSPYSTAWLGQADCVVIITNHSQTDWAEVVAHSRLIVDTRNATKNLNGSARVIGL
jgi:UDP-N-acetyl-D-glucosamine dehydrogenase